MTAEGGRFQPDRAVTRLDWVVALYRLAGHLGLAADADEAVLSRFADADAVPPENRAAMSWAVAVGVLQGDAAGRLMPNAPLTRAQTAATLQRVLPLLETAQ